MDEGHISCLCHDRVRWEGSDKTSETTRSTGFAPGSGDYSALSTCGILSDMDLTVAR